VAVEEENKMAGSANPASVTNPYQAASAAQASAMGRVNTGMNETAVSGIQNYQNPYETQVVQASLSDVANQAAMSMNQLNAQANQARAFGGARHGIQGAETLKAFNQQGLDTAARLRQQGFNTALGASQADLTRQLGAAGQMAGMGQQAFGYGQAIQQQQLQQGAMQQAAMQALIDAAKGQYAGAVGAPTQGLATFLSAITGTNPNSTAGTSNSFNPGLFNYLQVIGQMSGQR
jgi:hypothetical protein